MAGHTKGPWVARRMHTGGFDIFDPRNRDVVTVYGGGVEIESLEANARLISAAPELLEALLAVEAHIAVFTKDRGEVWHKDGSRVNGLVKAAISKATQP